ncbi:MAG TPA: chlorite dismutase family protein [Gemmatimonadaceae bacterium]|nr:chlorite dismutase family protein [Gemmatimonadaceae bacterium]
MNYAPETLEGWYALHQIFRVPPAVRDDSAARDGMSRALAELACPAEGGWTAAASLIGSRADVMVIHFRPTLDAIGHAQRRLGTEPCIDRSALVYSFLSVTEAGLYHISAHLAKDADERGGAVGDESYREALAQRAAAELAAAHVQRRLYPQRVPDMPYVCFYPMSKRREPGQNWYELSLEERSRLMTAHGMVGRRYAGRVVQVITGAIGLDAWEWGVTLFARDPLDFKKLVTEMRFDETSARYADFGEFFVGRLAADGEWPA